MGCFKSCFRKTVNYDDDQLNNKHDGQDQPLIDGQSPNGSGRNKKKLKGVKVPAEPNPFHKPSKSPRDSSHLLMIQCLMRIIVYIFHVLLINLSFAGGTVIEEGEDGKKIMKPYNVNEINRSQNTDEENQPKHSLVTASIMAQ